MVLLRLAGRSLLLVRPSSGSKSSAADFLQGLVTNDVRHLAGRRRCLYAMFLNPKGRVLYDTLLYREGDAFLVECDASRRDALLKHLNAFKVRRGVDVCPVDDRNVWAFTADKTFNNINSNEGFSAFEDPRLNLLGHRIVAPSSASREQTLDALQILDRTIPDNDDDTVYKRHRYKLGMAEGSSEIPHGGAFPLEANCDYAHGVSFQKGCYVGQELTARTYHTGVVRKRIMPLLLDGGEPPPFDAPIYSADGSKPVGKVRGALGDVGIALLRIEEATKATSLRIEGSSATARTFVPDWWPHPSPRDKNASSHT